MHIAKALLIVGIVTLSSCASLRGGGKSSPAVADPQAEQALASNATEAEHETVLRKQVQSYIDQTEGARRTGQEEVIRKRPYFFKEYSDYADDASSAEISLTETESRTAPFVADVKVDKTRYATRLHRSRDEARLDDNFLRDSGQETLTYELRNGRWKRVGSFFLPETTEEQVNGQWVAVQRTIERSVQAEEPKEGWFGRTISAITGRS